MIFHKDAISKFSLSPLSSSKSTEAEFLNAVIECVEDGILLLDSQGKVLCSNSSARRIFDADSENFPDLDLGIPLVPNGKTELDIHVRGELKTVELRALRRCEFEKCVFVVSARDITYQRELERRVAQIEEDLQSKFKDQLNSHIHLFEEERKKLHFRLNENRFREKRLQDQVWNLEEKAEILTQEKQELEMFGHIAGHDLKDSLRSLMLATDFITQHPSCRTNPELVSYREMIRRHSSHLMDLLRDIQSFTNIRHSERDCQETSMNSVCEKALESIGHQLEEKKAILKIAHLPWARVQPNLLSLVFQNLISNSLKFQPIGRLPEIEIFSGQNPETNEIFIGIKDNGIGIEKQYVDRLFQVFSRLVRRDEYEGSGLGLAICRKIIETYNGKIWLESTPNLGTTFFFSLPGFYSPEFQNSLGHE